MDGHNEVTPVRDRFGYLLKHARERLSALSSEALAGLPITGRELAVLTVVGQGAPLSQVQAAERLGIDRTTMVALLDELEAKGLVERRPDAADRRRNTVALTEAGSRTLVEGARATDDAERRFLAPLSPEDTATLRRMLQEVVSAGGEEPA